MASIERSGSRNTRILPDLTGEVFLEIVERERVKHVTEMTVIEIQLVVFRNRERDPEARA